jgi:CRISPR-associated protein Csm1
MTNIDPNNIAKIIFQDVLAITSKNVLVISDAANESSLVIDRTRKLIHWPSNPSIAPLESIFNTINLEGKAQNKNQFFWPPNATENNNNDPKSSFYYPNIPYPVADFPDITKYLNEFSQKVKGLIDNGNWDNPVLLSVFLEKYGSCISFGKTNIALNDFARTTAAVAAALVQAHNDEQSIEHAKFRLIAADISGIQKFIYNISSDGSLKSLRARSFFLELVTIEIVQQLLTKLELPQSNVIYSGGGKMYILAADTKHVEKVVADVRNKFNNWFVDKYQGDLFLATASINFPQEDIGSSKFTDHWQSVTAELREYKNRKFSTSYQLNKLLKASDSHEPCKVCHRDDTADLQPLNPKELTSSVAACITCRSMFQLGTQLFKAKLIVRSGTKPELKNDNYSYFDMNENYPQYVAFDFGEEPVYYRVFGRNEPDIPKAVTKANKEENLLNTWLIDNWDIDNYRQSKLQSILLGNYYQIDRLNPEKREDAFITAEELAKKANGIDRVGYLRMDVDNLGQIFASGLPERSLPQLAALSRQMNYFFKVYLNSLAAKRQENSPDFSQLTTDPRLELLFIYTGGDDIFISGAWNQLAEFAGDVYQSFRTYTCYNPSITISGGISINTIKYPLYQAAADAGKAEDRAKDNNRDSLSLFGETFKWSQWLGETNEAHLEDAAYLKGIAPLNTNILSIVTKLNNPEIDYSRAFLHNILILADIRERKIQDLKKTDPTRNDLIYYLHLPQLNYAISRLPQKVRDDPEFKEVRQALLNPRSSPYFRAIVTWIELLKRKSGANQHDRNE